MRVVIADSDSLVRVGLKALLSTIPKTNIVSEAASSRKLIACVRQFHVDLVVIDYTAKNFDIDVIPQILNEQPHLRFLAITSEQGASVVVGALQAGVYSYVKKDCDLEEIVDAVCATGKGKRFFCGQILETIRKAEININDIDTTTIFSCQAIALTEREIQIIKMVAEGLTNPQIAEALFLSNHTINTHRKNILHKLGVKNTAGLVMYAVKMNLVSPNKFLFAKETKETILMH